MIEITEDSSEYIMFSKDVKDKESVTVKKISGHSLHRNFSIEKVTAGFKCKEMKLVIKDAFVGSDAEKDYFGEETKKMSPARRYLERWLFLKSIGVPTVWSMRIVNTRSVVMGDMTRNGGEFFGYDKFEKTKDEVNHHIKRNLTNMEKIYMNINPHDIEKEVIDLQSKCWQLYIRLPWDDLFDLLVMPDGTFNAIVMDLSYLKKRKKEPEIKLLEEQKYHLFKKTDGIRDNLAIISG